METTQTVAAYTTPDQGSTNSNYYTTVAASGSLPLQAPPPYSPQYVAAAPVQPATTVTSEALAAGMFALIVVATGTMGANLHKVQGGDITINEAMNNSLIKGAAGGIAAASATAASKTFTSGGIAGLAVTLVAATGVSYMLSNT